MAVRSGIFTPVFDARQGKSGRRVAAAPSGGSGLAWISSAPTLLGDISVNNTVLSPTKVPLPTNGWALRIPTGLGAISACDPTKVTVNVSEPGWNTDGTPAVWTRAIKGLARIYKSYPNSTGEFTDSDQAAGTVEISLEEQLYNSSVTDITGRVYRSTIASITFEAGFLTGANGSSTAGTYASAVTRHDSKDYPIPLWKHVDHPDQRIGTDGYIDFEWSAAHEWAQKAQQFACLEAWARIGGVDGPVGRATSMTDSKWTSDGLVPIGAPAALHAPVYSTRIYATGLADGLGAIRSTAKPWFGPAVNSYDTGIGDVGISFNLMAETPVVIDVTSNKYSPIYAYVNQDGTGLVGTSTAGISVSPTDPGPSNSYQTVNQALRAAVSYNNTNRGHNDTAGLVIQLRDVAGSTQGQDANAYSIYEANTLSAAQMQGAIPVVVQAASGVRSDLVRMRPKKFDGTTPTNATKLIAAKTKFRKIVFDSIGVASGSGMVVGSNIPFGGGANTQPTAATSAYTVIEDCDVQGNGADGSVGGASGLTYSYRSRFANTFIYTGFANWSSGVAANIANSFYGSTTIPDMNNMLACYTTVRVPASYTTVISGPGPKQIICMNNNIQINENASFGPPSSPGRVETLLGVAIIGNLIRDIYPPASKTTPTMRLSADDVVARFSNWLISQNSNPIMYPDANWTSTRWNAIYNDSGWVRMDKEMSMKFNALAKIATKESFFAAAALSGGNAWSSGSAYLQGAYVYDSGTGSSLANAVVYQARRDVPASTPLSDTTYWWSSGVPLNTAPYVGGKVGSQPLRTGNKRFRMGVNCRGNVVSGSVQTPSTDHAPGTNNNWLSDVRHPGSGAKWGAANPLTYFVNDNYSSLVAGAGDYRPNPAGDLIGMVPAGAAILPFDFLGTPRKNDGTGAAGALEAA